ncbi:MAG: hypothetical protein OH344_00905 [Candidatus Parvarchaeota archaeon]|nr:hypothetical protein [Candidatus Jingweiarchaeum tengchongense]
MSENENPYIETIKNMLPYLEVLKIEEDEDSKRVVYSEKLENRGVALELKKEDDTVNTVLFYIASVDKKGNFFSIPKPVISKTLPGKLLDMDPNSLLRLLLEEWF